MSFRSTQVHCKCMCSPELWQKGYHYIKGAIIQRIVVETKNKNILSHYVTKSQVEKAVGVDISEYIQYIYDISNWS